MIIVVEKQVNQITVQKQAVLRVKILEYNIPSGITNATFTQKGQLLVGTGNGSFLALPPGVDGEYIKYDSTQPGGITTETPSLEVADTTNYLLNGGFDFAVGLATPGSYTTIADGGYGPDQWKSYRENADLQYKRVDATSISQLKSSYYGEYKKITNGGKILICQPIEKMNSLRFRGRTVSFQIALNSDIARTFKIAIIELQSGGTFDSIPAVVSAWNVDGTDPTLGTNLAMVDTPVECSVTSTFQIFKFTGTVPTTSKNLLVAIWSDADVAANGTLGLAEGGMRYGAAQQEWTPRHIQDEELLCSRFAELVTHSGGGRAEITTLADIAITFRPKYGNVSVSLLGTIKVRNLTAAGSVTATSPTVSLGAASDRGGYIEINAASWSTNFTVNNLVALNCDVGNGVLIISRL